MDHWPLVIEEIDAGAELVREFDKYEPVVTAFWLKASDEDQRFLYIASDGINDTNFDVAYGEVLRLVEKMQTSYLDPFRVKLVGGDDPLARASTDIQKRFPGKLGTHFGGKSFGGVSVDDVFIYPLPFPMPVS
ncbi:MAG: hypothetical protein AABP62_03550 [Planctomycetota bacterium]